MNYPLIEETCMNKPGVVKDYKIEWDATRYMVGGKMFAMLGNHKDGRPILSLKGEPFMNTTLRETFPSIIPGYYLNKEHWNSVYLDEFLPEELLKLMIDDSYQLVRNSLPKKNQPQV
jgi:predicted DNA-binding protein (MmcQ/YjbR family)